MEIVLIAAVFCIWYGLIKFLEKDIN